MKNFKGVFTALITPFKNSEIDEVSLERLVNYQIENNIHGLVVNGTTGESPTLSMEEQEAVFKKVKSWVGEKVPLVFGSGLNCTKKTIELSKKAEQWGADALLVVNPYYNKPPQRGLLKHFESICNQTSLPVILYNIPGRSAVGLSLESLIELSKIDQIIGVKEATGDISFGSEVIKMCKKDFLVTSGDDNTFNQLMSKGGAGVISVISNLLPKETVNVTNLFLENKTDLADQKFKEIKPVINHLNSDTNPITIKAALSSCGIIESDELRLPMLKMEAYTLSTWSKELKAELEKGGFSVN